MPESKSDATVETYQAVVMGITSLGLLIHSIQRLIAVWPDFIARIEKDTTSGLNDAVSSIFRGERWVIRALRPLLEATSSRWHAWCRAAIDGHRESESRSSRCWE